MQEAAPQMTRGANLVDLKSYACQSFVVYINSSDLAEEFMSPVQI